MAVEANCGNGGPITGEAGRVKSGEPRKVSAWSSMGGEIGRLLSKITREGDRRVGWLVAALSPAVEMRKPNGEGAPANERKMGHRW